VPANAHEIVQQWKDVHGITGMAAGELVDGATRQAWKNNAGEEVIESYTIPRMAHGTPLATGQGEKGCGAAGPFMLEAGISSSYHIAKFFGLTNTLAHATAASERIPSASSPDQLPKNPAVPSKETFATFRSGRINIGEVIASALKAAGLR
jgi:feruloyl esterase